MLTACCEGLHEQIVADMQTMIPNGPETSSGRSASSISADTHCGASAMTGAAASHARLAATPQAHRDRYRIPLHRPLSAYTLRRASHSGAFHNAVFNGATLIGVAVVGNPVAPALMKRGILEVNRLCVRRDTPASPPLERRLHALYGWCAREAERRGWAKIITYTRADEDGTSLEAAGWKREATVRGRGWHSSRRRRSPQQLDRQGALEPDLAHPAGRQRRPGGARRHALHLR